MRGSSSRSGPAPDPDSIRSERPGIQAGWVNLPTRRDGPIPKWPLGDPTPREAELWARQWVRPQATMWEVNGQEEEVAHYVRTMTDAERHGASVAARTLLLRQQETLGLSLPGLARNRWRISAGTTTEAPKRDDRRRPSAKERLAQIVELEGRRKPA